MTVLAVREISKAYDGVRALERVSFTVASGELVALIGPNGAGKTTCFNIVSGQLEPDSGDIALDGRSIKGRAPREIWRLGVGRTFQIAATFGSLTVRENVQMALVSQRGALHSPFNRFSDLEIDRADALLSRLGMLERAEVPCAALAYGDLKRVELAVALAHGPSLLLMDEPTAGMAPEERGALMRLADSLAAAERMAVLFTEHDVDVVFGHADRVLVLHAGQLIASGTPDEVRANPLVQEVYLGAA